MPQYYQTWGQLNFGIAYLRRKKWNYIINQFGIEVCYKKKFNPQITFPFHFLIQKYFFRDDPTLNIDYPEYLL